MSKFNTGSKYSVEGSTLELIRKLLHNSDDHNHMGEPKRRRMALMILEQAIISEEGGKVIEIKSEHYNRGEK